MIHGHRAVHGVAGGLAALVVPALALPVLVSALVVLVLPISTTGAASQDSADDPRAVELLRKSAEAAEQVSYTGTQYVSTWSALSKSAMSTSAMVQVRHQAGGQTEIQLHDKQLAILEGHSATRWLAGDGPVELLLGAYDVQLAGDGQVAGRNAWIVEAVRADGTLAARLWLDQQTALSLRREAFAADGYPLSASAFVDVTIGGDSCCGFATRDARSFELDDSALRWSDIENLRDDGWHCPSELADGMVLYEARRLGDAVQLSYSDGVMTVSVFEQPGSLDTEKLIGYTTTELGGRTVYALPGPPARLTWATGGTVVTVVAEAPLESLRGLTESLPPDKLPQQSQHDDGFVDRIGRGAQRVGSWINPFD